REPLSSVYGSEAVSGVINIISRRGSPDSAVSSEFRIGNFGMQEFQGSARGQWKSFQYSIGGSYLDIGEQVESDSFSPGTIAFQSGLSLTTKSVLNFTSRYQDFDASGFPENG